MKKIINTERAPKAIGPYVQAVAVGSQIFTSGQLGINSETGMLEEGIEAQTHASLNNLQSILKEAGMTLDDVIKTTVYVKDLKDFSIVNEIYSSYFSEYPARSCVQVAQLPLNGLVEIECIACK